MDEFEILQNPTKDLWVSCEGLEHLEKSLKTNNGRNIVTTQVLSILNGSFLFLQIKRTPIKACMSLNFVKIPSPISELALLDHLENW